MLMIVVHAPSYMGPREKKLTRVKGVENNMETCFIVAAVVGLVRTLEE